MKPQQVKMLAVAAAAVAVLLWLGVPPVALLVVTVVAGCPLMMVFMHGGHGGHSGHGGSTPRERSGGHEYGAASEHRHNRLSHH
ncbi:MULTISPECIES: DUF2933 domain-containing protein [Streptomyces]|uniref:DUF2933 domain-containing protein n=1 Tax=Streptomyces TaxID=1883 RepID=UPI003460DFAE